MAPFIAQVIRIGPPGAGGSAISVLGSPDVHNLNNTAPNPISRSHTAVASTRLLCVIITNNGSGADEALTSVTYGGVAMEYDHIVNKVYICWLHEPPVGTNTFSATKATSAFDDPVISFIDCTAGDPEIAEVIVSSGGSTSPATTNISPTQSGGIILWGIDAQWNEPGGPAGNGQVTVVAADLGLDSAVHTYKLNATASSDPQTWAFSSADPGYTALAVWIAGAGT